jgi:hypothetical protein
MNVVPRKTEGAGNAGCALHPRSRVQGCTKKSAHEHTGTDGAIRHSLRNGLTAYAALSPATNSSCHRRCRLDGLIGSGRIDVATDSLAPATGVGTTRFCRTRSAFAKASTDKARRNFRHRRKQRRSSCAPCTAHGIPPCDPLARRRCRVHRILSHVRDDREAPLVWERTIRRIELSLPGWEAKYF